MPTPLRVGVIGLGTTGSMAAWRLSRRPGVDVHGFEQFGIGHGYGAFTGESRLFRTAYREGAKYVPVLLRARHLWRELSRATDRPLLLPYGCLSIGPETDRPFQTTLESIERFQLPHELLTAQQLRERFPGMDIRADESGVIDLFGGAIRPELAVMSAIEQAAAGGATIHEHTRVTALEPHGADGPVTLRTETGGAAAEQVVDRVIITAGGWLGRLMPEVAELTEVRKMMLTWFLPRIMSNFDPANLPCFIRDRDGFHVFGAPSVDGYSVKISGMDIWGGADCAELEDTDLRMDRFSVSEFGRRVVELFPGVQPEPNRFSVHYDTYTATRDPILDRTGAITFVTGLSGHGFKMSPALGEMLAQLVVGDDVELYDEDFSLAAHQGRRVGAAERGPADRVGAAEQSVG